MKAKLIKEIQEFTKLAEREVELNKIIVGTFTEQEQKRLLPLFKVAVEEGFFHVLSIKEAEKNIRDKIKGVSND